MDRPADPLVQRAGDQPQPAALQGLAAQLLPGLQPFQIVRHLFVRAGSIMPVSACQQSEALSGGMLLLCMPCQHIKLSRTDERQHLQTMTHSSAWLQNMPGMQRGASSGCNALLSPMNPTEGERDCPRSHLMGTWATMAHTWIALTVKAGQGLLSEGWPSAALYCKCKKFTAARFWRCMDRKLCFVCEEHLDNLSHTSKNCPKKPKKAERYV